MKKITKIVTFYDDGTFTESVPSPGITAPYNPTPFMPTPVYPYTPSAPLNPSPYTQPWPSYPPYTITCSTIQGKENVRG